MSDTFITPGRLSPAQLSILVPSLGEKEEKVLRLLDDFHYAYGSQVQRLFFTSGSDLANIRARNRLLTKLTTQGLLHRYPRERLPGNRHGSTEHIYTLAHAGQRVMNELRAQERPYRSLERTTNHFKHALAVTELHVCMAEAEHADQLEVVKSQGEPACHRHFGFNKVLKPDYYVQFRTTRDGQRFRTEWFVEVERSRQGEPATRAKLDTYREYMKHIDPATQIMPRVLFICFTAVHRAHLARLLDKNVRAESDVYATSLPDKAIRLIIGGTDE